MTPRGSPRGFLVVVCAALASGGPSDPGRWRLHLLGLRSPRVTATHVVYGRQHRDGAFCSRQETSAHLEPRFQRRPVHSRSFSPGNELQTRECEILRLSSFFPFSFTSKPETVIANGQDATSSEEEAEEQSRAGDGPPPGAASPGCCDGDAADPGPPSSRVNGHAHCSVNGSHSYHSDEDEDEDDGGEGEPAHPAVGDGPSAVPTIYFSHTVEPKRVRILFTLLIGHVI